jgi:hypothetical protein
MADAEMELSDALWAWLVDEDGKLRAAGFDINEWTDRPAAGCDCDACALYYDSTAGVRAPDHQVVDAKSSASDGGGA